MRLLLAAGEMHYANHLMRRVGLDKEATIGVESRRRVARHPIAIGRQKVHRQMLGEDYVVERRLLDKKELRPLQYPRQDARPGVPMRRVVMQCEYSAIDHRIAAQTVGRSPAKRFAVILPRQAPAEWLWPLVMAFIGAVDLGCDRQLVGARSAHIKIDCPGILQPGIRIDPQVSLV